MADMTNRSSGSGSGCNNCGAFNATSTASSTPSRGSKTAVDLTNSMGAKAPRSMAISKAVQVKQLGGQFKTADTLSEGGYPRKIGKGKF